MRKALGAIPRGRDHFLASLTLPSPLTPASEAACQHFKEAAFKPVIWIITDLTLNHGKQDPPTTKGNMLIIYIKEVISIVKSSNLCSVK